MATLSKEQKKKYLVNPNHCPFCNSDNISSGELSENDGNTATAIITCYDCDEEWTDVYTLTDVQ